ALVGVDEEASVSTAIHELARLVPDVRQRFRVYVCNWSPPDLALDAVSDLLRAEVTQLLDLTGVGLPCVPIGTKRLSVLLRLAVSLPRLRRFDYLSTAFVSGDRVGIVAEADLARGQGFKNRWEAEAFAAEQQVRAAPLKVPLTIYRPTFLVGDSRTGEIDRFDGPYAVLRLFEQLAASNLPPPMIGRGAAAAPLVPVDYVATAIARLTLLPAAAGRTIQLADPDAPTVWTAYRRCAELLTGHTPRYSLSPGLTTRLLRSRSLRRWDVSPEVVPYLNHRVTYETRTAHALLAPLGILPPSFQQYVPALVEFFADHCDDPRFGAGLA
ncbi:MAG TPA: SDR family oxidoreductase, partial [Thermomicrobiales bacterium]